MEGMINYQAKPTKAVTESRVRVNLFVMGRGAMKLRDYSVDIFGSAPKPRLNWQPESQTYTLAINDVDIIHLDVVSQRL